MTQLDLRVKRELRNIPEGEWADWKSEAKVIADMCQKSGMQDKTIAIEVGIDPAVLSKVQSGQARLSEAHMDALMDALGSEAWLHYWMLKRGYDPRRLARMETDLERENRLLREQLQEMSKAREVELRMWKDLRAAA